MALLRLYVNYLGSIINVRVSTPIFIIEPEKQAQVLSIEHCYLHFYEICAIIVNN